MTKPLPVDSFDLIIFGGYGDLALRKLLPGLWHRDGDDQLPKDSRIIAVGRKDMALEDYVALIRESIASSPGVGKLDRARWSAFSKRLSYVALDAGDYSTWGPLGELLSGREDVIRAIYLATPPDLFGTVARGFVESKLMTEDMRIVLEKPVGHDFSSARAINDEVGQCFPENQIFRIDHYLGKETVQNLLALRFGNSMFEPLWRREMIDHVQITVSEQLGTGNRTGYYDGIGALRDMVQNHLLQLLCLVAMEPPVSFDDDAVRDEKMKVLKALRPITAENVRNLTVRGQYEAGAVAGEVVQGYTEELGGESGTETFAALKVELDNWRWSGVPFYLRTGKRMHEKLSEIVIQFKPVPYTIFGEVNYDTAPNRLSIMLQPDEGMKLYIMAKEPTPGPFALRPVALDLSFEKTFGIRYRDAYERLVIEVLRGNPALFMRRDEVEEAWRWTDGILESWETSRTQLETYVAGSWGPTGSFSLIDRDGRSWFI